MSNNKKFISARPDTDHGEASSGSYSVGTNLHLRASSERQSNLQAYAYHLTKEENVRINLSDDADTASIRNYQDNDKPVIITIPLKDIENPFSELDDEEFYASLQYAWTLHEAGHYLFSDQPAAEEAMRDLEQDLRQYPRVFQQFMLQLSKDIWNALEDGAMEEAIRMEKGPKAAQRLAVKNETFIAQGVKTYPERVRKNVSIDLALHLAAMDLAKYDTGALRRLLDEDDPTWGFMNEETEDLFFELYDGLRETVEKAFTSPNAVVRTYVIFDFISDVIELLGEQIEQPDQQQASEGRDQLREGQQDDMENQSGPAQQQQAEGLQQKSRQDVAQQHANVTQQTVTTDAGDSDDTGEDAASQDGADGDADGADGNDEDKANQQGQQGQDGQENQQSADGSDAASSESGGAGDGSDTGGDSDGSQDGADGAESAGSDDGQSGPSNDSGGSQGNAGGADSGETEPPCPQCGSDETERRVQTVDGMIAARVNAPFDIHADWVGSITFVSNEEVCGFRVKPTGNIPREQIEANGYKVVDVSKGVEILEPKHRYGDSEPVNGFGCTACGHEWVPTIGGDSV